MKLHRFFVGDTQLEHEFWLQDKQLFHQWSRVLRFEAGREVVLFNAHQEERLYRIIRFGNDAVQLELVTEMVPQFPKREVYLCFALLKKDKVDWVLQKGTELGVRHFVPLLTDRTEKTGFDSERAQKIIIEAAEQCGRSDIPTLREPLKPESLLQELEGKVRCYIAEQESVDTTNDSTGEEPVAIIVGPEGGWSDDEKQYFADKALPHLSLGTFTLRAETACLAAVVILLS